MLELQTKSYKPNLFKIILHSISYVLKNLKKGKKSENFGKRGVFTWENGLLWGGLWRRRWFLWFRCLLLLIWLRRRVFFGLFYWMKWWLLWLLLPIGRLLLYLGSLFLRLLRRCHILRLLKWNFQHIFALLSRVKIDLFL